MTIGRRRFISTLGGAAVAWPFASWAQQTGRLPTIGILYPGVTSVTVSRVAALREGLRAVGYADADRVEILVRASEGDPSKLAALAAELVEGKVDVIVPISPSAVRTAKSATTIIPLVANDLESDPVRSGFVASLAHPGGNITGVFADFPEFATKWLELLKETMPALSSVVMLWDPATGPIQREAVEAAGRLMNVKLEVMEIRAIAELGARLRRGRRAAARCDRHPVVADFRDEPETDRRPHVSASYSDRDLVSRYRPRRQPDGLRAEICWVPFGKPVPWSARSCRACGPRICRSSARQNSRWSSTSRPPRRLA